MSDYVLTVPKEIVDRAQAIADRDARSVDDVLVNYLYGIQTDRPILEPDEESELAGLALLTDDALWTMAREVLPPDMQAEMQKLMDDNDDGTISDSDFSRLEHLVDRSQRLMVRKGAAMAHLKERGHSLDEFTYKQLD